MVICPDRDEPGINHAKEIAADFHNALWLYSKPEHPSWNRLPKTGGFDVADWISDLRIGGLSDSEVKERMLEAIMPARKVEVHQSKVDEGASEDDDLTIAKEEITELQGYQEPSNTLNVARFIHPSLAKPLTNLAKSLGQTTAPYLTVLLPTAASFLDNRTRIVVNPFTGHKEPANLWVALVGKSGSGKSPIIRAITSPLKTLQAESFNEFQEKSQAYDLDLEEWQALSKDERKESPKPVPPKQRHYYFQNTTFESLIGGLSEQPDRNSLTLVDELSGHFNSFDEYRSGGKGADRQRQIEMYDGEGIKMDRKSVKGAYLERTGLSICGGIQPGVLKRQIDRDGGVIDGFWTRMAFCPLPNQEQAFPTSGATHDLSGLLKSLYQRLEHLKPVEYRLSDEALSLFAEWHKETEKARMSDGDLFISALYPKLRGRTARIALILHLINECLQGFDPNLKNGGVLMVSTNL